MKAKFLLMASLLAAVSAGAVTSQVSPIPFKENAPLRVLQSAPISVNGLTPASSQIITEVPVGEVMQEVLWSSKAGYPENNKLTWTEVSGFVPTIVTYGSEMYIYAPLTALREIAAPWIKGTISEDGTKVTFPTPQAYLINEATPGVQTMLYATRGDGQTGKPDESNMNIVFSYVDGELTQIDGGVLMLTDIAGNFYGYAEMDMSVTKIKETPVSLPEDITPETFYLEFKDASSSTRYSAMIGQQGDDVYFSNPLGLDTWFKGVASADGKQVSIPTPQYMGSGSGYPLWLVTGRKFTRTEIDPMFGSYEVTDYEFYPNKEIVFTYDEETGIYSSSDLMILSSDKEKAGNAIVGFEAPAYHPWVATPVNPADPSVSFYMDLKEYEAFGLFGCMMTVEIPYESAGGDFIPQENLYYCIYIDGSPLEIYGVNMIPYLAQISDAAIQTAITVSGMTHQIQTPVKPSKTLGVQSFYEYEGQLLSSELVTYNIVNGELEGASVESLASDAAAVIGCYDLTGRRVAADAEGVVIRKERMSDGSVKCVKVLNTRK